MRRRARLGKARRPDSGPEGIVTYWHEAGPDGWFDKDASFDADFRDRYFALHMKAAARECDQWLATPQGTLALLILLDQFPRNAFRGTAHMYATDALALAYARDAARLEQVQAVDAELRLFFCLPFAHSESLGDQDVSVKLTHDWCAQWLPQAESHRTIIQRFGRFPHRNAILLRESTEDEACFLAQGGFAG
jgi:uncharacterized protein (DUF924 family)